MGVSVRISTELLARLFAQTAASPTIEVCGLLFGDDEEIAAAQPCRNVAADPACRFEIDPAALIAAWRAARAKGRHLIGCYHSHPSGTPEPSMHDAANAAADGWLWLILTSDRVLAWRAVEAGERHGRFDPTPLVIAPRGCAGAA